MAFVQDIYYIRCFLQKGKLALRSLLFRGSLVLADHSLLSGFANTCDFLSLISEALYFQRVITILLELNSTLVMSITFSF